MNEHLVHPCHLACEADSITYLIEQPLKVLLQGYLLMIGKKGILLYNAGPLAHHLYCVLDH
jgi:hypothetical protein